MATEEHLCTCGDGKVHVFPFFKILQENKSLGKSYEDSFIHELKSLFLPVTTFMISEDSHFESSATVLLICSLT